MTSQEMNLYYWGYKVERAVRYRFAGCDYWWTQYWPAGVRRQRFTPEDWLRIFNVPGICEAEEVLVDTINTQRFYRPEEIEEVPVDQTK